MAIHCTYIILSLIFACDVWHWRIAIGIPTGGRLLLGFVMVLQGVMELPQDEIDLDFMDGFGRVFVLFAAEVRPLCHLPVSFETARETT
jgi:hypothetical protein